MIGTYYPYASQFYDAISSATTRISSAARSALQSMIKSIPAGFEPLADVNASSNTIGQFIQGGTLQQNIGSIIQKMNEQGLGNFNIQAQIVYQNMIDVQSLNLAANSISSAKAEVANLFNSLDIYRTALVAYVPASNGTDVQGFVTTVNNALKNEKGKVQYLTDKLGAVTNWMSSLANNVKVLGRGMSTRALEWVLNNGPLGNNAGGISYGGRNNLTFAQAASTATADLLNAGVDFMNDAVAGIKRVVGNKSAAEAEKIMTSILSVLGGVLGGVGNLASSAAFWIKNGSKSTVGSELIASLVKETSSNTGNLLKTSSDGLKSLKPTKNALGILEIRANSDWAAALRTELGGLGSVSSEVNSAIDRYVSAYSSLTTEMLKAMSDSAADNLTKNANVTPRAGMAVNRSVVDSLSKSPVTIALRYIDFDGNLNSTQLVINPNDWKGVNIQNPRDFKAPINVAGYLTAETWVRAWMETPGKITLDAVVQGFNVKG